MLGLHVPGGAGTAVCQIPVHHLQHPARRHIDGLLAEPAIPHGLHHAAVVAAAGGGHLQVQPRGNAGHAVAHRAPVAHDQPVKAPVLAEHAREQLAVLGSVGAVEHVVGAHDRPGLCALHGLLEGGEVDFPQGTLVNHTVGGHAAVLLAVGGEVLDTGAHALALHAVNQAHGHLPRQIGILAEILKVAPAQGGALDIHCRAQNHAQVLMLAGLADFPANGAHGLPVKAGRRGAGGGEAHGLDGVVDAQVIAGLILLAQSVGAVGHHHGGDAQALYRLGVPKVRAGEQGAFFLQGHFGEKLLNIHMNPSFLPSWNAAGPRENALPFQRIPAVYSIA